MDSGFRTALIFGSATKHLCQDSKSQTAGPHCDSCDENSSDAFLHLKKKGKRDIYIMSDWCMLKQRFWFLNQIKCRLCLGGGGESSRICRIKTT